MNTKLTGTTETVLQTPEQTTDLAINLEIPRMGDKTVALINKALDFVRRDPRLFRFDFDINSFEMDVMVVNQYHNATPTIKETNELLQEKSWERGSKAYLRAYKTAQQVFGRFRQLESQSAPKYKKHHSI